MRKTIPKIAQYLLLVVSIMATGLFPAARVNALIPQYNYMGKVTNIEAKRIVIKTDYGGWSGGLGSGEWEPFNTIIRGKVPNDDAINEIKIDDYVEVGTLGTPGNPGSIIALAKMISREEKIVTGIFGDPRVLILNPPSLLDEYQIKYKNTPDCSKCTVCNCPAKYTKVTVTGPEVAIIQLDPKESYLDDRLTITFHSGQASAYPDCTDQGCVGPQPISNFTIHLYPQGQWEPYRPSPEMINIEPVFENQTYVRVKIQAGPPCDRITWGTVRRINNKFSANVKVYGRKVCIMIYPPPTSTHVYPLGQLPEGKYQFILKVWDTQVKSKEILVPRSTVWSKTGIFPSPVTSSTPTIHIERQFDTVTLMIFNLAGSKVFENSYTKNDAIVNLSDLDNGVYLYVLIVEKDGDTSESEVKKLLILR